MQPSGLAALRSLRLLDAVLAHGAQISRLDGRDLAGRRIMDMSYERWRPGAFGLGVHRASLFQTLHDAAQADGIEIRTGAQIVRTEGFRLPHLHQATGAVHGPFDLVVVADGSASQLRRQVRPGGRAPLYPWGAMWANAKDPAGRFAGVLHQRYHRASTMIGILPIGRPPDARSDHVSFFWSLRVADMDAFLTGDIAAWRARVVEMWPESEGIVRQLGAADFSRAVYRDMAFGRWDRGAVVLIGDAAHGTSPQLGQGANLALLDSVELAERVDAPRQVANFQRARRLQTGPYQLLSRLLTPLFQSSGRFWPWFRTFVFAPLTQAPGLRRHAARVLTGTFRLGPTPRGLQP